MFTRDSVTVITAATGHRNLLKSLASVQQQTYNAVEQLLVIDGPERRQRVEEIVGALGRSAKPLHLISLEGCPQVCSSRRHTVNYTVGNRPDSVRAGYFLRGNQVMRQAYPGGLPWE